MTFFRHLNITQLSLMFFFLSLQSSNFSLLIVYYIKYCILWMPVSLHVFGANYWGQLSVLQWPRATHTNVIPTWVNHFWCNSRKGKISNNGRNQISKGWAFWMLYTLFGWEITTGVNVTVWHHNVTLKLSEMFFKSAHFGFN